MEFKETKKIISKSHQQAIAEIAGVKPALVSKTLLNKTSSAGSRLVILIATEYAEGMKILQDDLLKKYSVSVKR
jgi:prolyl-tRNA editing enzyme YbaK/EbsC (Cys-tRNA(Pro) deacylase)